MRRAVVSFGAVLACLAAPATAEDLRVLVRNDLGVPKVVPVYWEVDGRKEIDRTDLQGKVLLDINCDRAFRIYLKIDDVMARRIAPKAHDKCPKKGRQVEFTVQQR